MEETAELIEESWRMSFVDAFVHQLRNRMPGYGFSGTVCRFFAALLSIYLWVNCDC